MTRCTGIVPLPSRPFALLAGLQGHPGDVAELVAHYGSPINVLHVGPMAANHAELATAAQQADVAMRVFFARKANKSIALLSEALRLGLGVDVASQRELEQALHAGARGEDLIVTAAVKSGELLRLAARAGAVVALDHAEEVDAWAAAAADWPDAPAALRLGPVLPHGIPTRFGMPAAQCLEVGARPALAGRIRGVQFHLDGYAAADRALAATQALEVIDALRALGHPVEFLDIGGGIPMRYVDDDAAWDRFWSRHRAALLDETLPPLTFRRHGLGLHRDGDGLGGSPAVYPVAQQTVRGEWLRRVLDAPGPCGRPLAERLTARGLQLRCEPGRSLLDGCGVTVASVAFTKQAVDGLELVGVEMNRTQLRSAADDFLVDPVVLRPPGVEGSSAAQDGHLVGAYCIERELITWRTLRFPQGVTRGDLVLFPNTAGYMMHILESASHQLPLAANVVVEVDDSGAIASHERDPIDVVSPLR